MSSWRSRIRHVEDIESYYEDTGYLEGGTIDDAFDILTTLGYASGGMILGARIETQKGGITGLLKYGVSAIPGLGQAFEKITGTKGASYYAGQGMIHRIEASDALEIEGFIPALAVDIISDPLNWIGVGLARTGVKLTLKEGVEALGKAALEEVVLDKKGLGRLKQLTKGGMSLDDAKGVLIDEIENVPGLARKYLDMGGLKFGGHTVISGQRFGDVSRFISMRLPKPANRVLQGGWRTLQATDAAKNRVVAGGFRMVGDAAAVPFKLVKRAGAGISRKVETGRAWFGETFEVGYKLKQLPGKYKDFHSTYMAMVEARQGAELSARHAMKELGRPYKKHGDKLRRYLEEGVSTGVEGFDDYIESSIKPLIGDWLETGRGLGLEIGEQAGYFPHIVSEKGLKYLKKQGIGTPEETVAFLRNKLDAKYSLERVMEGTVEEINEVIGFKFFETDAWDVLAKSAGDRAKDFEMRKWLDDVSKRFGIDPVDVDTYARQIGGIAEGAKKKVSARAQKIIDLEGDVRTYIQNVKSGVPLLHPEELAKRLNRVLGKENVGKITRDIVDRTKEIWDLEEFVRQGERDVLTAEQALNRYLNVGQIRKSTVVEAENLLTQTKEQLAIDIEKVADTRRKFVSSEGMEIQRMIIDPLNQRILPMTKATVSDLKGLPSDVLSAAEDALSEGLGLTKLGRRDVTGMFPRQIAAFLDDLDELKSAADEDVLTGVRKLHRGVMSTWKQSVTTGIIMPFMDFFNRNVISGISQNYTRLGIYNPVTYLRAWTGLQTGRGTYTTLERGVLTTDEMLEEARKRGVLSNPGILDIPVPTKLFPTAKDMFLALPRYMMSWSEDMVRVPAFIDLVQKMSFDDAAKLVGETHFRYAPEFHTKTEQRLKEFVMPFYTFAARNLALHIRNIPRAPKRYATLGKIQRALIESAGMEEEYEALEAYEKQGLIVPSPFTKEGEQRGFIRIPTPHTDVLDFMSGEGMARSLFYMYSPVLKVGFGLPGIWAGWGSKEFKLKESRKLLMDTAIGRYIRTAKKWTDPSTSVKEKAAQQLGMRYIPVKDEPPSMEEFEAARWIDYEATKEEDYAAWLASGSPTGYKMRTIGIQPSGLKGVKVPGEKIAWHTRIWRALRYGDFKSRAEGFERPDVRVLRAALDPAFYEMTKGFKPSVEALEIMMGLPEEDAIAEYRRLGHQYIHWERERGGLEVASQEQKMVAWLREEMVDSAPDSYYYKSYHDKDKGLIGVAAFNEELYEELKVYLNRGLRLTEGAKVWAFHQDDVTPVQFIMGEMRRMNEDWLNAKAARDELKGFRVDEPIPGDVYGRGMVKQSASYTQWRIDYQKELVNRALQRGEFE